MAQYTMTLLEVMEITEIFDFNYPFYKEEYRKKFEEHFIDYFLLDEIAHETIMQFKHRLKVKLNTIMPYYNKIFETQEIEQRILDNYDVTEKYEREIKSDTISTNNSTNKNLYKDAPKTRIDIEKFDVVTNLSKDINDSTGDVKTNNTETWTRSMTGNIGVQTDSDAIIKYWDSIRKVEDEIFNECQCLFMGVF